MRAALESPPVRLAALAVCIAVTFQILLPVVPAMVERSGPHGAGGAATAALFMGAVAGEIASTWLMAHQRSSRLLVAGQLVTAFTSLIYVLPHPTVWAMMVAAFARGLGMGLSVVVSVAVLSDLTAARRRGSAIGVYSLALSVPGIAVPSLGVLLRARGHADVDALIAFASAFAGALIALRVPNRPEHLARASTNLLSAARRPGLLVLFAGFVLACCTFGGVATYAPVALPLAGLGSAASFLLAFGVSRALFRWLAGVLGDRLSSRTILFGSLVGALLGLVLLAAHLGGVTVVVAAIAYGGGYGGTQTAAFLALSDRGSTGDAGAIAALWNAGIDLGASLGGTLIGLAAAEYGYLSAVWVLPIALALSLPLLLARNRSPQPLAPEAEIFVR